MFSKHKILSIICMFSSMALIGGLSFASYGYVFQTFGVETVAKVTDMRMEHTRLGTQTRYFYSYKDSNGLVYTGNAVPSGKNTDTIFVTDKMTIRYLKLHPQYSSAAPDALGLGINLICIGTALLIIGTLVLKMYKLPSGEYDL